MGRVIGVDLGARAVKVAVMEGSFGRYSLKQLHSSLVERGEGDEGDLAPKLRALREIVQELEVVSECAVAWPSSQASVRVLELPFSDKSKLAKIIPFEVENHVPFDMDEMLLDHRVIEADEGARVLTCVAPELDVRVLLEELRGLGLEPRNISIDGDALAVFADEGAQAIVDLGYGHTTCSMTIDGRTVSVRSTRGIADLIQEIADRYRVSLSQAEAALIASRGPDEPVDVDVSWDEQTEEQLAQKGLPEDLTPIRELTARALAGLFTEIRMTLITFEDKHQREIDEVILAGASSQLPGLVQELSEELGVPVRLVTLPLEEPNPGMYASAFAMGKIVAGEAQALDLRQGDLAHHGSLEFLKGFVSFAVILAGFFLIAAVVLFFIKQHKLNQDIAQVEQQIVAVVQETFPEAPASLMQDADDAVEVMQVNTTSTLARTETLGEAIRGEPPTLTLLRALSEAMPPPEAATIDVQTLTLSETVISIAAETTGYEAAATIESSLQGNPKFQGAKKGDEKKRGDKLSFSLTIPLEGAEGEEVEG